jgi:hypothetical protein
MNHRKGLSKQNTILLAKEGQRALTARSVAIFVPGGYIQYNRRARRVVRQHINKGSGGKPVNSSADIDIFGGRRLRDL